MSENWTPDAPTASITDLPPSWVPPHVGALVDLLRLGDELVAWNGEACDGDEQVSGADAVEFLCEHRERVRGVIAEYRRKRKEPNRD